MPVPGTFEAPGRVPFHCNGRWMALRQRVPCASQGAQPSAGSGLRTCGMPDGFRPAGTRNLPRSRTETKGRMRRNPTRRSIRDPDPADEGGDSPAGPPPPKAGQPPVASGCPHTSKRREPGIVPGLWRPFRDGADESRPTVLEHRELDAACSSGRCCWRRDGLVDRPGRMGQVRSVARKSLGRSRCSSGATSTRLQQCLRHARGGNRRTDPPCDSSRRGTAGGRGRGSSRRPESVPGGCPSRQSRRP